MSKVVPGEVVPGEVVPGEVVDVESPPAAVVDAQPPANEYGGVVQGHVVAPRAQRIHPEPRANEVHAATLIQAKARSAAAWKDFPLPPGATSATSVQGWWCVRRR